jgi:hypothetical protein
VVGKAVKVELTFLEQCRVGVRRSGDGDRWWWCGFNASISAREGM